MSKVINKDGKWVVVDDQGGVQSTPFTERSAADSFMNLRDAIISQPPPTPARTGPAYGPPAPGGERPEELSRARPAPSQYYGPAPNVQDYGPPAASPPPSQRPWRPANTGERDIYRAGADRRNGPVPGEAPNWLQNVNMSKEQWRALLAGLGVQNMPSTPNPNHPEEY